MGKPAEYVIKKSRYGNICEQAGKKNQKWDQRHEEVIGKAACKGQQVVLINVLERLEECSPHTQEVHALFSRQLDESSRREGFLIKGDSALTMSVVNRRNVKARLLMVAVLLLGYIGFRMASGNHEPVVPARQPVERVSLNANNRHDLSRDESRGGHTLERHVGRTDAQLRERLQSEDVSAASTYNDRATAEMAVAAAIRENSDKVNRWLQRPGGHSNLVLDYDSDSPVGRSMRRGESQSFACSHAVAILKFVNTNDYYVLTSYPDCWKPS